MHRRNLAGVLLAFVLCACAAPGSGTLPVPPSAATGTAEATKLAPPKGEALLVGLRTGAAARIAGELPLRSSDAKRPCWSSGELVTVGLFRDEAGGVMAAALPGVFVPSDEGFRLLYEREYGPYGRRSQQLEVLSSFAELDASLLCEEKRQDQDEEQDEEWETARRVLEFVTAKAICERDSECQFAELGCGGLYERCLKQEASVRRWDSEVHYTVFQRYGLERTLEVGRALGLNMEVPEYAPDLEPLWHGDGSNPIHVCLGWQEGVPREIATLPDSEMMRDLRYTPLGPARADLLGFPAGADLESLRAGYPGLRDAAGTRTEKLLVLLMKHESPDWSKRTQIAVVADQQPLANFEAGEASIVMAEQATGWQAQAWRESFEELRLRLSTPEE